ncbi:MAG: hemerythrin domain-containing protein [Candidatus Sulfotelmatobacter sp.]|jgi:hemerythrin-like domain-containing protein
MLRDKSLIPLSRQHQHALALCVRVERASPVCEADLAAWQKEVAEHFRGEIRIHFSAEEQVVFPAARRFEELVSLVEELQAEHVWLRDRFAQAEIHRLSASDLSALAQRLSAHIRKEERRLFEPLEELMMPEELAALGKDLAAALKDAAQTCVLPTETARLRPGR